MKKSAVPAIIVVAVLIFMLVSTASASQDNWWVTVRADDGAATPPASGVLCGVYPGASDGYSRYVATSPGVVEDGLASTGLAVDTGGTAMHVVTQFDGVSDAYNRNIISPTLPAPRRTWTVYAAAGVNSTASVIRPVVTTHGDAVMPPATFDGIALRYALVLLDNKGIAGAPANGTRWELPVRTTHDTTAPYWTCPVNLPVVKISTKTNAAIVAEGYKLQLVQEVVPEPASILALGSGLLGLAGIAIRRRRS